MAEELKKEDRRVRRTKKLLTKALTELLQTKQINEITVKELTDLADMNRGTFYLYYKDIFDMLEKIEEELFQKLDAIAQTHEHGDLTEQVKPILLDLFHFIFAFKKKNAISSYLLKENNYSLDMDIDVQELIIDDNFFYVKYMIKDTSCIYEFRIEVSNSL